MAERSELLSSMAEEELVDLYNRLRLFTYKRYYWLRDRPNLDLEGIIQEAIIDTLQGNRRWPPAGKDTVEVKQISLFVFLCNVIRSKVSHACEREKRQVSLESIQENTSLPEPQPEDSTDRVHEALLHESANDYLNLVSREDPHRQLLRKEVTAKMLDLVSHDATLTQILRLWLEEPDLRPRQIVERTGLPVKQVYRTLKRLQKHLVSLQAELQNG